MRLKEKTIIQGIRKEERIERTPPSKWKRGSQTINGMSEDNDGDGMLYIVRQRRRDARDSVRE